MNAERRDILYKVVNGGLSEVTFEQIDDEYKEKSVCLGRKKTPGRKKLTQWLVNLKFSFPRTERKVVNRRPLFYFQILFLVLQFFFFFFLPAWVYTAACELSLAVAHGPVIECIGAVVECMGLVAPQQVKSQFPYQGSNLHSLHWKVEPLNHQSSDTGIKITYLLGPQFCCCCC